MSESKFRSCPADFVPHILNPNPEELLKLITKPAVEAALLVRLDKKARWYGGELDAQGQVQENKMKLNVACIVGLYRDWIIPLTKEVEVRVLCLSLLLPVTTVLTLERLVLDRRWSTFCTDWMD